MGMKRMTSFRHSFDGRCRSEVDDLDDDGCDIMDCVVVMVVDAGGRWFIVHASIQVSIDHDDSSDNNSSFETNDGYVIVYSFLSILLPIISLRMSH